MRYAVYWLSCLLLVNTLLLCHSAGLSRAGRAALRAKLRQLFEERASSRAALRSTTTPLTTTTTPLTTTTSKPVRLPVQLNNQFRRTRTSAVEGEQSIWADWGTDDQNEWRGRGEADYVDSYSIPRASRRQNGPSSALVQNEFISPIDLSATTSQPRFVSRNNSQSVLPEYESIGAYIDYDTYASRNSIAQLLNPDDEYVDIALQAYEDYSQSQPGPNLNTFLSSFGGTQTSSDNKRNPQLPRSSPSTSLPYESLNYNYEAGSSSATNINVADLGLQEYGNNEGDNDYVNQRIQGQYERPPKPGRYRTTKKPTSQPNNDHQQRFEAVTYQVPISYATTAPFTNRRPNPTAAPRTYATQAPYTNPRTFRTPAPYTNPRTFRTPAPYTNPRTFRTPAPYTNPRTFRTPAPYTNPRTFRTPAPYTNPRTFRTPAPYTNPRTFRTQAPYTNPRTFRTPAPRTNPRTFRTPAPYTNPRTFRTPAPYTNPRTFRTPAPYTNPRTFRTPAPYTNPRTFLTPAPFTTGIIYRTSAPVIDQREYENAAFVTNRRTLTRTPTNRPTDSQTSAPNPYKTSERTLSQYLSSGSRTTETETISADRQYFTSGKQSISFTAAPKTPILTNIHSTQGEEAQSQTGTATQLEYGRVQKLVEKTSGQSTNSAQSESAYFNEYSVQTDNQQSNGFDFNNYDYYAYIQPAAPSNTAAASNSPSSQPLPSVPRSQTELIQGDNYKKALAPTTTATYDSPQPAGRPLSDLNVIGPEQEYNPVQIKNNQIQSPATTQATESPAVSISSAGSDHQQQPSPQPLAPASNIEKQESDTSQAYQELLELTGTTSFVADTPSTQTQTYTAAQGHTNKESAEYELPSTSTYSPGHSQIGDHAVAAPEDTQEQKEHMSDMWLTHHQTNQRYNEETKPKPQGPLVASPAHVNWQHASAAPGPPATLPRAPAPNTPPSFAAPSHNQYPTQLYANAQSNNFGFAQQHKTNFGLNPNAGQPNNGLAPRPGNGFPNIGPSLPPANNNPINYGNAPSTNIRPANYGNVAPPRPLYAQPNLRPAIQAANGQNAYGNRPQATIPSSAYGTGQQVQQTYGARSQSANVARPFAAASQPNRAPAPGPVPYQGTPASRGSYGNAAQSPARSNQAVSYYKPHLPLSLFTTRAPAISKQGGYGQAPIAANYGPAPSSRQSNGGHLGHAAQPVIPLFGHATGAAPNKALGFKRQVVFASRPAQLRPINRPPSTVPVRIPAWPRPSSSLSVQRQPQTLLQSAGRRRILIKATIAPKATTPKPRATTKPNTSRLVGAWSEWQGWSACSAIRRQTRTRTCHKDTLVLHTRQCSKARSFQARVCKYNH